MNTANIVDTARLNLLLNELRLPAIKVLWPQFAEKSDKEGWPAARFLATIAEHEIAEAAAVASSATSSRRGCPPERPSTTSTSRPCR
jgi:hypothetical protein